MMNYFDIYNELLIIEIKNKYRKQKWRKGYLKSMKD